MRVVFDTNVIIDAAAARQPFCEAAEVVLLKVSTEQLKGYVTANSITDIFYILCHSLPKAAAKNIIRSLLYSLDVINVDKSDCWCAVNSPLADFEDALLLACAKKVRADYIVTRDESFLQSASPIRIVTPGEFLAISG